MRYGADDRGVALIAVLSVTALIAALGLGVAVTLSTERLATANLREAGAALLVAESGLALAADALAPIDDWSDALRGTTRPRVSDPVWNPVPLSDGEMFDMVRETNRLTCGRTASCSQAQRRQVTRERPWGDRNPAWQPFIVTPFERIAPSARGYALVVWVGDDVAEQDGNVLRDGSEGQAGRYAMRVHALALGPRGTRRSVEAVLFRRCTREGGRETCEPRIRVQAWHSVHPMVP